MSSVGNVALLLALIVAAYAVFAATIGSGPNNVAFRRSAHNALNATALLSTLAIAALLWSLLSHDFRLEYVYEYTSTELPFPYLVSALWAGQEGSFLFWTWMLSVAAAIATWRLGRRGSPLLSYSIGVTSTLMVVFLAICTFLSNPFGTAGWRPGEGNGLNPLLENPSMAIHPPAVFLGYVGFTIAFVLCLAALISGKTGPGWTRAARPWAILGWLALGLGNLFGAQWAYVELGWGGYWGWDPVENGSLLPWLTGTAFVHSLAVQRLRGRFRLWNYVLAIVTFCLCILGTYLVRSGAVSSVHAYGESPIGNAFLALLIAMLLVSVVLLLWRRKELASRDEDSAATVSRESGFALTNIVFLVLALVVLWGTLYPAMSLALSGREVALGPGFFNQVTPPVFGLLLLIMAICPVLAWRSTSGRTIWHRLRFPLAIAILVAIVLLGTGERNAWALFGYSVASFVIASTVTDWSSVIWRQVKGSGKNVLTACLRTTLANRPRYGGHVVHLGIALIALAITGSATHSVEKEVPLHQGETTVIGGYALRFDDIALDVGQDKETVIARLSVFRDESSLGSISSSKVFHRSFDQPVTDVGIMTTASEDLYVILADWDETGQTVTFKVLVNGMMVWMWIGTAMLLLGGLISLWPGQVPSVRTTQDNATVELGRLEDAR